jgi:hypothetical protein
MASFIERLANASREELEAPATRAVQAAIERLHNAGISTVGSDAKGQLVVVHPNGKTEPYAAKSKAKDLRVEGTIVRRVGLDVRANQTIVTSKVGFTKAGKDMRHGFVKIHESGAGNFIYANQKDATRAAKLLGAMKYSPINHPGKKLQTQPRKGRGFGR